MNNLKNETKTVETTTNWDENYTSGTTIASQIRLRDFSSSRKNMDTYLAKCL